MDARKLQPLISGLRNIRLANFKAYTKRHAPFAVCPACDNPIQIIGLYRLPKSASRRYGRHTGESVPRLDDQARKILQLLIDHFDHVVYVLGIQTRIWLTRKRLEDMLDTYRQMKGFMYMGATLINVPWIFAYMSNSFPLFYQKISDNPMLVREISHSVPQAHIDERGRLTARKSIRGRTPFLGVEAFFAHHDRRISKVTNKLSESMKLVVTVPQSKERMIIYSETIFFDHDFFQRLICSEDERHRQPNLVDLARSRLGDLLL